MPLAQETETMEDLDELQEELDELEGDDELAGMSPEQLADVFEKEVSSDVVDCVQLLIDLGTEACLGRGTPRWLTATR